MGVVDVAVGQFTPFVRQTVEPPTVRFVVARFVVVAFVLDTLAKLPSVDETFAATTFCAERLNQRRELDPRLNERSAEGNTSELICALTVRRSDPASPNVIFPFTVRFPAANTFPLEVTLPEVRLPLVATFPPRDTVNTSDVPFVP